MFVWPPYTEAGHQCAAVIGEEEREGPGPIGRSDLPEAQGLVMLAKALHRSFHP
ncbi:hypothetical protein ACQ4WX_16720 [Streptomyces lasalocidi]